MIKKRRMSRCRDVEDAADLAVGKEEVREDDHLSSVVVGAGDSEARNAGVAGAADPSMKM